MNHFDLPDDDAPELTSDFEMVHDDELGHDITRREARDLSAHRARFDKAVKDGYFNKPRVKEQPKKKAKKAVEEDSSEETSDE